MSPLHICIDEGFRRGTIRGSVERATSSCLEYYEGNGVNQLTFDHVKQIVEALDAYGAFEVRHAVNTVAKLTGVSRTTIYGFLKK